MSSSQPYDLVAEVAPYLTLDAEEALAVLNDVAQLPLARRLAVYAGARAALLDHQARDNGVVGTNRSNLQAALDNDLVVRGQRPRTLNRGVRSSPAADAVVGALGATTPIPLSTWDKMAAGSGFSGPSVYAADGRSHERILGLVLARRAQGLLLPDASTFDRMKALTASSTVDTDHWIRGLIEGEPSALLAVSAHENIGTTVRESLEAIFGADAGRAERAVNALAFMTTTRQFPASKARAVRHQLFSDTDAAQWDRVDATIRDLGPKVFARNELSIQLFGAPNLAPTQAVAQANKTTMIETLARVTPERNIRLLAEEWLRNPNRSSFFLDRSDPLKPQLVTLVGTASASGNVDTRSFGLRTGEVVNRPVQFTGLFRRVLAGDFVALRGSERELLRPSASSTALLAKAANVDTATVQQWTNERNSAIAMRREAQRTHFAQAEHAQVTQSTELYGKTFAMVENARPYVVRVDQEKTAQSASDGIIWVQLARVPEPDQPVQWSTNRQYRIERFNSYLQNANKAIVLGEEAAVLPAGADGRPTLATEARRAIGTMQPPQRDFGAGF